MVLLYRATVFALFLIICSPFLIKMSTNNTCTSYVDYFLINFSGNCYNNPDIDLSLPEVIKKYVGNFETYNVTSSDGYIFTIGRVSRSNPNGVVLFQPPMGANSFSWIMDGNHSLPFRLWKMGYEVWFVNPRGSLYSRMHVNLTDSDSVYYNFSFYEIAVFDFDVQVDLIRSKTNNTQITFVGYSTGATEALIYGSLNPKKAQKYFKTFILLAPAAILGGSTSGLRYLCNFFQFFEYFFGMGEVLLAETSNYLNSWTLKPHIVNALARILLGGTVNGIDTVTYPFFGTKFGKGMTIKLASYIGQLYTKNNFSFYDYGVEKNRIVYGSDLPPDYPLQNIRTLLYIIYGQNDTVTASSGMEMLYSKLLPKNMVHGTFLIPSCNHIDLLFSKDVRREVHRYIIQVLNKTG